MTFISVQSLHEQFILYAAGFLVRGFTVHDTQGFLTATTLQIDATIGWSDLGILSFWPMISNYTLIVVIKSWKNILDITLEVPEEIIGGAAVVKFQNKV